MDMDKDTLIIAIKIARRIMAGEAVSPLERGVVDFAVGRVGRSAVFGR